METNIIDPSTVYWITRCDAITVMACVGAIISGAVCAIFSIKYFSEEGEVRVLEHKLETAQAAVAKHGREKGNGSYYDPKTHGQVLDETEAALSKGKALRRSSLLLALRFGTVCSVFSLITTFVPTTQQAAAIYMIPKIANNEQVQKASSELYTIAMEWLKELHPKQEK